MSRVFFKINFLFVILLLLNGCLGNIKVTLPNKLGLEGAKGAASDEEVQAIQFPYSEVTLFAGDNFTLTPLSGEAPYNVTNLNYGSFDSGALTYDANGSLSPTQYTLNIQDDAGLTGQLQVNIVGLQERFQLEQIKTFGDQNYPMSIVQSDDGSLYASSVIIDGSGWEDWAVWKSSNNGATWDLKDRYLMYLYGESHPLQLTTYNNDVYVCGYVWGTGATPSTGNSEWLVKKSSDGGNTWQIVDHWYPSAGDNVCYSIDVSATGEIFTSGYAGSNDSYVRMSSDNGQTWQTIGTFTGQGVANSIRISPSGHVWVKIDRNLFKGIYSGGVWNWSGPYAITALTLNYVAYQKAGELEIVSDTVGYYTGKVGGQWRILETTDGGQTWSEIYATTGEGVSIKRLSSGEIISLGNRFVSFNENYLEAFVSLDNGATWTKNLQSGGIGTEEDGGYLVELQNGDVLALGERDIDNQMVVHRSADKGATWSQHSIITYYDYLYTNVEDYTEDTMGNIYTAGWIYYVNPADPVEPYAIMKSSDNGQTWSASDYIALSGGNDHYSTEVEATNANRVFAIDEYSGGQDIRMTSDFGATWTTVHSSTTGASKLRSDTTGNIYYTAGLVLRRGTPTGSSFSDVFTFPVDPTHTSVSVVDLLGTSDGAMIVLLKATESATQHVLAYRSLDQGQTWSEIYRVATTQWSTRIRQDSTGALYILANKKIVKSSDGAITWNEIYDGTSQSPSNFVLSNDNRVFILSGDTILIYSNAISSWVTFWDVDTAITPTISNSVNDIFNCRFSSYGVCVNVVDYTKYNGNANYLWAVDAP